MRTKNPLGRCLARAVLTGADMGRKSTVTKAMRAVIEELLAQDDCTIDDLTQCLQGMGHKVSRSAVARTTKDIAAVASEMRATREMARAWAKELGNTDATESQEAIVQMLHTMLVKYGVRAVQLPAESIDPLEIRRSASAVKSLMDATEARAEMEEKIRAQAKAEAEIEARARLEGMLSQAGRDPSEMTTEELEQAIVDAIRR